MIDRIGSLWAPRDPVARRRIAEDVGAVAERSDDVLLGRRQLGPERGAQSPAEPAGRGQAEVVPGFSRGVSPASVVLVEDHRVRADQLADHADQETAGAGFSPAPGVAEAQRSRRFRWSRRRCAPRRLLGVGELRTASGERRRRSPRCAVMAESLGKLRIG